MQRLPVLGICGHSGSGKTTLIEELIPRLTAMRLRVGVIKHHGHRLELDREGKDSDRFFRAGADVVMSAPGELAFRSAAYAEAGLDQLLAQACRGYDLVLLEGFKAAPGVDRVWLRGPADAGAAPAEADGALRVLPRGEGRAGAVMDLIGGWLPCVWRDTPVYAGLLVGGASSRMGRPKHLLRVGRQSYLAHAAGVLSPHATRVVLLGRPDRIPRSCAHLPVLPDAPGREGPLAGMLAALQWAPLASWVFAACDLPLISDEAVRWLLDQRAPGVWATQPTLAAAAGRVEPLFAHYDFRAAALLGACRGPAEISGLPKVRTPEVPVALRGAWTNVNTPAEARSARQQADGR